MLSYELYDIVMRYILGDMSLSELQNWLIPREPWILRRPESDDSDLVGAIEHGFVMIDHGVMTEEKVKEELSDEIHGKAILVGDKPESSITLSAANTNFLAYIEY